MDEFQLQKIDNPIAVDHWGYQLKSGEQRISRIEIGQPQPVPDDPNGDWYCPISIEGFTEKIVPAFGVGPVDSLMNAITLVRMFADHIGEFSPRALENSDNQE